MSPFRALAAAHLQSTWNRLRRQRGAAGLRGTIAVALFLTVTLLLPLSASLAVLGYLLGVALASDDASTGPAFGGLGITLLTVVAGAMGGLASGSRQLPWETLRGFPVRSFTIFRAELFAGAAEAITAVELGSIGVICIAACVPAPSTAPLLLVLFVSHTIALLAVQQLFGSLAQRLARRFRAMLVLLPILAVSASWGVERLADRVDNGALDRSALLAGWQQLATLGTHLPAGVTLTAARALLQGTATPWDILLAVFVPIAAACAFVLVAFWFVARERPLTHVDNGKPAERLWSFTSPVLGIARLQWQTLLRSLPGRFGLLMPLFTLVLVRGPLSEAMPGGGWTAPFAFGYASFASANLLFNQFGLDRHGVKVLFLLPIEPHALLRGKLLGFAAWQVLQAGMLALLLEISGHHEPGEILVGVVLSGCIFLVLAMVGQFASIWQPRPLKQNGMRAGQPPFLVVVLIFSTLISTCAVLYGLTWGVHSLAPGWELPTLGLVGCGLAALLFPVMRWNARYLIRNRERLVETLGSVG